MGFDIRNLVKALSKGAPIIGSLIGGPAGGAAGTALALLAKAFGVDPDSPEEILTAALMFYPLPEGSSQAVYMLFGALAGGFGTVLQYFFGSSKGSSDKTRMMAELEHYGKAVSEP